MRNIYKSLEIPAPSILGAEALPVFAYSANELFIPD